jgi:peptidoglycan/xylan/chitin deacetylase (PgdA/CDA1 family)
LWGNKVYYILVLLLLFFPTVAFTEPIPVLMYHRVSYSYSGRITKDLTTSPDEFRIHLNILKAKGYRAVTFKDMLYRPEGKLVILTFDDGRDCHYEVMKILESYGMKGVFFIAYNSLGGHTTLSREQVIEISKKMEIGSHTMTHPWLKKCSDEKLQYELFESKKHLENLINQKVISIAYPYGNYNSRVLEVVHDVGYIYGRTTDERIDWDGSQSLKIPVVYIHDSRDLPSYFKGGIR